MNAFASMIDELPLVYDAETDSYSCDLPQMEYIGDVTYKEYEEITKDVSLFSFPTEVSNRYVYFSAPVIVGRGVSASGNTATILSPMNTADAGLYVGTPINGFTNGYNISNVTADNQYDRAIATTKGSYYDFYVNTNYDFEKVESINVEGSFDTCVFTMYSNVAIQLYPSTAYLIINGEQVGDAIPLASIGDGNVSVSYTLTEDVTNVGFRLYFNNQFYRYEYAISASGAGYEWPINVWFRDQTVWTTTEKDVNTGLLQSLLDWIIGIYNSVFVPDSQKDDADAFQSEVSGTVTEADNVKTELDELEKPEPEEIDTDLSGIISDETYTQQTQIFVDLLKFEKITNMLLIVFTMALISYVLFGKKG